MPDQLLLTVEEAAGRLSIGRSRLYQLLNDGMLESLQLGRSRRIPAYALEAFVERLRAEQTPPPVTSPRLFNDMNHPPYNAPLTPPLQ